MKKATNVILQEVVSPDGVRSLRYKGRDGRFHYLDVNVSHDLVVANVRPFATPVDTISRLATPLRVSSMVFLHSQLDTKPTTAEVATEYVEPAAGSVTADDTLITLSTSNDEMFDVSDTILVQGVYGYDASGTRQSNEELVLYVVSRDDNNGMKVQAVNGKKIGDVEGCVPSIDEGTPLIRMGRAATELDVMSPQFEALASHREQFCQIFRQSAPATSTPSDEDEPLSLNDVQEAAIHDMRLSMEKSFLFGVKGKIWDNVKMEYVMLTGGIWKQAGKEFFYNAQSMNQESIIDMIRRAFTGNNGSKHRILIGGSELVGTINKLDYNREISAGDTITKWGIDFTELRSKFGTLYVLLSEVFDECGMAANGLIIDPAFMTKIVFQPFEAETVTNDGTESIVYSEASGLVLRNPKSHMRIVKL